MICIDIKGFLNGKRYEKILLWSKDNLGKKPNLKLSGEVLDNFLIKSARRYSTRIEEAKTNTEVYCCDSILLQFNKSNEKLVNVINKPNFNIFEVGFVSQNGKMRKYHIPKTKWKNNYVVQDMGNVIEVSLNGTKKEGEI